MKNSESAVLDEPRSLGGVILLENVRWSTYEALLEDLGDDHPGTRLHYDRGLLEIMTTSSEHEWIKKLVGRFLELMTLHRSIEIRSSGSATWKRKDLQRGFESDECYYVGHERVVRGKAEIDVTRDPPPDLVLEIDISRSSLKRQDIYAAFGVPEAWRFDGHKIRFYRLGEGGEYEETETSTAFPFLSSADLNRFLSLRQSKGETRLMTEFSDWIKKRPG